MIGATIDRILLALVRLSDPPRYCRTCGKENSVDVCAIYDGRTGAVASYRWAVACDAQGLTFKGEGYWSGNGATHLHAMAMELNGPPTWVPPEVVADIIAKADGHGYLRDNSVTERLRSLADG